MTAWSNVIKASPMKFGQTSLAHMTITFDEIDAGGVVYHPYHLKICDRARNQGFAAIGWGIDRQMALREGFTVFSAEQRYLRPIRMEDVSVASRLVEHSKRSITVQHAIFGGNKTWDEVQNAHGALDQMSGCRFFAQVKLVYIANASSTSLAMPEAIRQALGLQALL